MQLSPGEWRLIHNKRYDEVIELEGQPGRFKMGEEYFCFQVDPKSMGSLCVNTFLGNWTLQPGSYVRIEKGFYNEFVLKGMGEWLENTLLPLWQIPALTKYPIETIPRPLNPPVVDEDV